MPPTPSTCITCGKPFAANRELASIPDASKIAFDPAHRRVWRICASCEEWNLLGPEASAAALPEIEARFASAVPATLPQLALAPARVSDRLELLRLGPPAEDSEPSRAALRLKREADRRARQLRWVPFLLGVTGLAVLGVLFWSSNGDWIVPIGMIQLYALVAFVTALSKKMYGERTWRGTLPVSATLALVATVWLYFVAGWDHLKYGLFGMAAMLPYFFFLEPLIRRKVGILRFTLANGRRLRISQVAIPDVTISWAPEATNVTLYDLPDGRPLSGPDVARVYRFLYGGTGSPEDFKAMVRIEAITREAYGLLQAVGGLPGLLRSLEGFRRERDGRVPISDLPMLYRVALDLALSAEYSDSDTHDALRDRALAAAEVAEEAEALDEERR
ncbi:MAG: hypothetical protein V4558_02190 [Gemmatimonadota bacterium]